MVKSFNTKVGVGSEYILPYFELKLLVRTNIIGEETNAVFKLIDPLHDILFVSRFVVKPSIDIEAIVSTLMPVFRDLVLGKLSTSFKVMPPILPCHLFNDVIILYIDLRSFIVGKLTLVSIRLDLLCLYRFRKVIDR